LNIEGKTNIFPRTFHPPEKKKKKKKKKKMHAIKRFGTAGAARRLFALGRGSMHLATVCPIARAGPAATAHPLQQRGIAAAVPSTRLRVLFLFFKKIYDCSLIEQFFLPLQIVGSCPCHRPSLQAIVSPPPKKKYILNKFW
jgi:hypothetical protein